MIRKIRYRDLRDYLNLRNSCFYADPSLAPALSFKSADRIFFVVNKVLRYFLPVFKTKFNVWGYYIDGKLVGFEHVNQRHTVWPYRIPDHSMQIYAELRAVEHKHKGKGIGKSLHAIIGEVYKGYDVFSIVRKDNVAALRSSSDVGVDEYDKLVRYGFDLRHAYYEMSENFGNLVMCREPPGRWKQLGAFYIRSLRPEVAEIERPKSEWFKVSRRYRFHLFLFFALRLYDEAIYVWTDKGTRAMKMFAHVRSNLMTKETELVLIADPHASSEEVLSLQTLLVHLSETGQRTVTTHVRSNHRSVHDALKFLGFTSEGEYVCRVRKVAA